MKTFYAEMLLTNAGQVHSRFMQISEIFCSAAVKTYICYLNDVSLTLYLYFL